MIVRPREILEGEPDAFALRSCIGEHMLNVVRMHRLYDYYEGKHDIAQRSRSSGLPNNRISHGFPRYISTVASGYLLGRPVAYRAERQSEALRAVTDTFTDCAVDSVDIELARNASIFGKGVELVFAGADASPRTASIDPRDAFVVYDDTVEHRPLLGIHLRERIRSDGARSGWITEVYTRDRVLKYQSSGLGDITTPRECRNHYFGDVPMIEYWNSEDERGDFETVLPLIDAYDQLQSDRLNDKQQFVDALLLLYGCTMEPDDRGRSPGQQLREDKALVLPDADARAEWLCKQLNEADTEVLKTSLVADIHKLSMVPDLTDEHFAGNTSGVAMRYKLLGLEQLARIKERWFREALRHRLRLFGEFMAVRGAPKLDVSRVEMMFTRSLPVDELEQAKTLNVLKGMIDDQVLNERAAELGGMR